MSTYLAPLSPTNISCPGRGPPKFGQPQERNEKQKAKKYHQELLPQLHTQNKVVLKTVEEPTARLQVKLFSLAMTAQDTFAQAKVAAINWRNETRPRVTELIDGVKVNLL